MNKSKITLPNYTYLSLISMLALGLTLTCAHAAQDPQKTKTEEIQDKVGEIMEKGKDKIVTTYEKTKEKISGENEDEKTESK